MSWPTVEEMTDMSKDVQKYVDASMFAAAPMREEIQVSMLWMTPDPLGAIAAACRMYEGKPTYHLSDITDEERRHYFTQAQQTHLTAPLEFVRFHFFIEGVDRAFTHQMVRQRTAVFAQESLRFAVKADAAAEAAMPPSIKALDVAHPTRQRYSEHMREMASLYNYLVANDIPAEDARSILPHNTTTRLNYNTDLRNLSEHSGNRLCTQAQFVWREVFTKIVQSIRGYKGNAHVMAADEWQFDALADSGLFRPACYRLGRCPFKADFDRGCTIRGRVDAGEWDDIDDIEWLYDEKAAWT